MKKVYAIFSAAAVSALSLGAQQLPNVGFEGEWEQSKPWNPVSGTDLSMDKALEIMGQKPEGGVNQPKGWVISNVLGVVSVMDEEYGGGFGALGSTITGDRIAGNGSESAVALVNRPNPFMPAQIVPAYISLGTGWATNTLDTTWQPVNKDGGVFGGLDFSYRPDAVVFDYKLAAAEGAELQKATALVYAWKGTWTQVDVPAANSMSATAATVTMTDRERNILGIATSQGGEITKTDDAELIAKNLIYIETPAAEWTSFVLPIEYLTVSEPSKFNVVLSANDYFDSEKIVKGNTLSIDNVKVVYYSRLKSVTVAGTPVEGFSSDNYAYTIDAFLPEVSDIAYEYLGTSGCTKVEAVRDEDANTMTLKVSNTNTGGLDTDGEATHEYVLAFTKKTAPEAQGIVYAGNVVVDLGAPSDPIPANVHIVADPDDPTKCTLSLPNFSLGEGAEIGDIIVPNVTKTVNANGDGYEYSGMVENLTLSLAGMPIHADVKVTGTTDANGNAKFDIPVTWLTNYDADPTSKEGVEIGVVFNGQTTTPDVPSGIADVAADEDAPVEYYNLRGVRISQPEAGQIVIRRQGSNVSKIIVK